MRLGTSCSASVFLLSYSRLLSVCAMVNSAFHLNPEHLLLIRNLIPPRAPLRYPLKNWGDVLTAGRVHHSNLSCAAMLFSSRWPSGGEAARIRRIRRAESVVTALGPHRHIHCIWTLVKTGVWCDLKVFCGITLCSCTGVTLGKYFSIEAYCEHNCHEPDLATPRRFSNISQRATTCNLRGTLSEEADRTHRSTSRVQSIKRASWGDPVLPELGDSAFF